MVPFLLFPYPPGPKLGQVQPFGSTDGELFKVDGVKIPLCMWFIKCNGDAKLAGGTFKEIF